MGELYKFGSSKVYGINAKTYIPLDYVDKDMVTRIKKSNISLLYVYPMDKPLIELAHKLGGKASDIVRFILDGSEHIFFAR